MEVIASWMQFKIKLELLLVVVEARNRFGEVVSLAKNKPFSFQQKPDQKRFALQESLAFSKSIQGSDEFLTSYFQPT